MAYLQTQASRDPARATVRAQITRYMPLLDLFQYQSPSSRGVSRFGLVDVPFVLQQQQDHNVSYDCITGRLKIYSMAPSPLHQAVTGLFWFLSSTLQSAQWFLTEYEADRVMTDSNLIMIRTATNRPTGKKPMAFSIRGCYYSLWVV